MAVNSINTNIAAYFAQANIGIASASASSSVARLSSGNRIVKSSDDVAALSTGTSLRTEVNTLRVALTNAAQGSALLQVADGGLTQINEILTRQKAIALQAGSGSVADSDRVFLNQEFQALSDEIDRLVANTNFNGVTLIDGSLGGSNPLQSANGGGATIAGFVSQTGISNVTIADNGTGTLQDSTFYGNLDDGVFTVEYTTTPDFTISYNLHGSNYVGIITDATTTGGSFTLTNGEATITFTVSADISATYAVSTAGAAALETALTNAFASATGFADRLVLATNDTVNSVEVDGTAIETEDTDATLLDGMDGGDFQISSQFYDGENIPTISDFRAVGTYGIGVSFSVTISGRTYTTGALADATDLSGNGGAGAIITGIANNTLRFYLDGDSTTNANEYMDIDLADSTQIIDVDTQNGVDRFLDTLNNLFGRSGGGLSFQIGSSTDDTLSVNIGNADTETLFESATLDVLSQVTAATASEALDVALDTITSLRATVGALQSRFNFASSSIQVSIQNQDAARGELLDTDVASESTNYATAQVKLQAGISVLAQANQILQTLLKLIG